MARFTIYFPSPEALKASPASPSTYRARFVAWDTMGGTATEATLAESLGQTMNPLDVQTFAKLEPGERTTRGGMVYQRH